MLQITKLVINMINKISHNEFEFPLRSDRMVQTLTGFQGYATFVRTNNIFFLLQIKGEFIRKYSRKWQFAGANLFCAQQHSNLKPQAAVSRFKARQS